MTLKKNTGVKITLYNTRCLSVLLQDSVNLTPNVANCYGYVATATNQAEFEAAIAVMEEDPLLVQWLE